MSRGKRPVRLTRTLHNVLEVIVGSSPTAPAWPRSIRERTGYGKERVYTALDKMVMAGWVEGYWEDKPVEWKPRRFYRLTEAGWVRWGEAVQAEADRAGRGPWWRVLLRQAAGD